MLVFHAEGVALAGSGMAVPGTVPGAPEGLTGLVTNEVLVERRVAGARRRGPEATEFLLQDLRQRVGLHHRHHARAWGHPGVDGEPTSATLAVEAARAALVASGISVNEVALVLVATSTPPRWTGTTAALVCQGLGVETGFMDVRMGCAGGLAALGLGAVLAASSRRPVVVVGADTFSRAFPPAEVLAPLALGDAAAAVVVTPGTGRCSVAVDGAPSLGHLMGTPGTLPPTAAQLDAHAYALAGDPDAMGREALPRYAALHAALGRPAEGTVLIHATQEPLMAAVAGACGVGDRRGPGWLARYANTGTANVLLGHHLWRSGGGAGPWTGLAVGGGVGACGVQWEPGSAS